MHRMQLLVPLLLFAPVLSYPTYTLAQDVPPSAGAPNPVPSASSEATPTPPAKLPAGASNPVLIWKVDPAFSEQARAAHFSGIVLINLVVDENGLPQNVHVVRGVGMGLDENAVAAVKKYRFKPSMKDGKPIAVQLNVQIQFQADRSPEVTQSVPVHLSSEASKARASGTVVLELTVDEKGLPRNVHVLRGFGLGMDEKAVDAVKQYKFKPFEMEGKPAQRAVIIEVSFGSIQSSYKAVWADKVSGAGNP